MKFETKDDVKKWLRLFPLAKKELKAKIDLYTEFIEDCRRLGRLDSALAEETGHTYSDGLPNADFYRKQIMDCKQRCNNALKDWERLSGCLDGDEALVITEKYFKGTSWDAMEFVVYFSRRQCFRILDRAAEKLVGKTVGGDVYE